MRVLVLTTQKGGAGKTTLATSVAVAAMQDGEQVLLLDADPQSTAYAWGQRRGVNGNLLTTAIEPDRLAVRLAEARAGGIATLVVVDTAGSAGPAQAMAIEAADYCLVPVKPSLFDVDAVKPTVRLLRTLGKRYSFVLNQVNVASAARNLDAASALVANNGQSPPMVGARNDFLDAAVLGLGVTEYAPKGKSAAEIKYLWSLTRTALQDQ
jgi:chromosome partitioning protein